MQSQLQHAVLNSTAHLHTDVEVAHLEQHILVLPQVSVSPPHVPEPQQQVEDQHCSNDDLHDQCQDLEIAVLQVVGTVWVCSDGCTPNRPHLIICIMQRPLLAIYNSFCQRCQQRCVLANWCVFMSRFSLDWQNCVLGMLVADVWSFMLSNRFTAPAMIMLVTDRYGVQGSSA